MLNKPVEFIENAQICTFAFATASGPRFFAANHLRALQWPWLHTETPLKRRRFEAHASALYWMCYVLVCVCMHFQACLREFSLVWSLKLLWTRKFECFFPSSICGLFRSGLIHNLLVCVHYGTCYLVEPFDSLWCTCKWDFYPLCI